MIKLIRPVKAKLQRYVLLYLESPLASRGGYEGQETCLKLRQDISKAPPKKFQFRPAFPTIFNIRKKLTSHLVAKL